MGNRATVIFWNGEHERAQDRKPAVFSPAVYLHWNGGPESVYAFLEELERRQVRADQDYECARFVQLVGEFFDNDGKQGGLSLGIANGPENIYGLENVQTDHGDNGFYVVYRGSDAAERQAASQCGAHVNGIGWVRRFTERWYAADDNYRGDVYIAGYGSETRSVLCEWNPTAVAAEGIAAAEDEYNRTGIRESFAAIAGDREVAA